MASAYDEIKKALVLLRQGQPITEQTRAELRRVKKSIEQHLIKAELFRNDLPASILDPATAGAKDSSAHWPQADES